MIAIDVGSGLTKTLFEGDSWCIPSIVAPCALTNNIFIDKATAAERLTLDTGQTYFVGATAMANTKPADRTKTTNGKWFESKGSLVLHYSSIARAYPSGKQGVLRIVTGLPMSKYKSIESINLLKKALIGKHKFKTDNAVYDFEITEDSLILVPQALGLHLSALSEGLISQNDFNSDIFGYIDFGTYTSGYCQVQFSKLSSHYSDSVSVGMYHLAKTLEPHLKKTFNYEPNDLSELLHHLRAGFINHRDTKGKALKIDLLEESNIFIPETFKEVFTWIENNWRPNSMQLFISGGGAKYLLSFLKSKYPHVKLLHQQEKDPAKKPTPANIKKADEKAIFDVVRGYLAYGLSQTVEGETEVA